MTTTRDRLYKRRQEHGRTWRVALQPRKFHLDAGVRPRTAGMRYSRCGLYLPKRAVPPGPKYIPAGQLCQHCHRRQSAA